MSEAKLNADGWLGLMLTELRLPTIKRLAGDLCDQSDREGWAARQLLERLFEQEMAEREVRRFERHRAASALSPDKRLSSYERKSIAITANTPFSQWGDVFVDPATTLAASIGSFTTRPFSR